VTELEIYINCHYDLEGAMTVRKDSKDYVDQKLIEQSNLKQCPLLAEWMAKTMESLQDIPERPERKGVPRGEQIGMPRAKARLHLYKILNPKFSLKKYSEIFGFAYGTVRNWTSDDEFLEQYNNYVGLFTLAYLTKLKELMEKRVTDEVGLLVDELEQYQNPDIVLSIYRNYLDFLQSEELAIDLIQIRFLITLTINSRKDVGDEKIRRKTLARFHDWEKTMMETAFKSLTESIAEGDKERTQIVADNLKSMTLTFMENCKEVSLKLFDKSGKRSSSERKKRTATRKKGVLLRLRSVT